MRQIIFSGGNQGGGFHPRHHVALGDGLIAEYLTALIFFTGAMLLAIAPPGIIFSGFSSGAFWLIFGGLTIGVGINVTGLGTRIAGKTAHHLNRSYARVIAGLVFFGALFGLLMPSALGRVILLVPIAMNMADHFGLQKGRKRGGSRHYCRCTGDKAESRPYFILSPSGV